MEFDHNAWPAINNNRNNRVCGLFYNYLVDFGENHSGEGIAEGMRLIESMKTLYLLLVSIRVLRRNTKKQKGLYNMSGFEQKTPFEGVFL